MKPRHTMRSITALGKHDESLAALSAPVSPHSQTNSLYLLRSRAASSADFNLESLER
jgi:hypothetical protein